ncbi:MAG: hypothetical protein AAGH19_10505 [Pseudomonadota bacterium]
MKQHLQALLALLLIFSSFNASAIVLIEIFEADGNVEAVCSGSADITDLTPAIPITTPGSPGFLNSIITSSANIFVVGAGPIVNSRGYDIDSPISSPFSASITPRRADSATGSNYCSITANILDGSAEIFLPLNYVSESPLSGRSVFNGRTLRNLNLVEGVYVYTWGDTSPDGLVIRVSQERVEPDPPPIDPPPPVDPRPPTLMPVPAMPHSWVLVLLVGLLGLMAVRRLP